MTGPPTFHVPDVDALDLGAGAGDVDGGAPAPGGAPELTLLPGGAATLTVDQVRAVIELPFAVLAVRRGDHWKLRADESVLLAEPLTRKLNDHARVARAISLGGDWAVIGGSLVLIVSARLLEDAARDDADRPDRSGARGRRLAAHDDAGASRVRPAGDPGDLLGGDRLDAGRPRVDGSLNGGWIPDRSHDAAPDQAVHAADPWDLPGQAG